MAAAKKKIIVKLVKSSINTKPNQRACLKGLGLGKIGSQKELENTPFVRGMVKKVIHLISFVEV